MGKHNHLDNKHPKARRTFSASAHRYDALAKVQEHLEEKLLAKIPKEQDFFRILDVGMGTGRMAEKLARKFPQAHVLGIDFAEGMVSAAQKRSDCYQVIQADAQRLPFREGFFDLIISNQVYQWVENLPEAFRQNAICLSKRGVFLAAFFGWHSLRELFECLAYGGAKEFFPRRLPSVADAEKALGLSGFKITELHSQILRWDFHDMWQLMVWLKNIGANALPRRGYIGKDILMKANQYYYRKFKTPEGIKVSFEVIWLEAKKA